MAQSSSIEWTEATWNPVTGCSKVSPGCEHCYAERMSHRLKAMGNPNYANGFTLTCHPHMLQVPLQWKKPRLIFVNSMSDLFHPDVPIEFLQKVFEAMRAARWHVFQVLTKRSERLAELNKDIDWPANAWMGVSVETRQFRHRIAHLRQTQAATKFISFEPLLGSIPELDLTQIDWAIVGGESGPGARPLRKQWAVDIRDQCLASATPFFFKQWGGVNRKRNGRILEGRTWDQMPTNGRIPQPAQG